MNLILVLLPFLALTARAEDESLMTIHRIETETAERIQARVLDPILGAGQTSIFVRMKLEVKRTHELSDRFGDGQASKITTKTELSISTTAKSTDLKNDLFGGFGFPDTVKPPYQTIRRQKQTQESRQTKDVTEDRTTLASASTGLRLVILHDAKIAPSRIAAVRGALLAVYRSENADIKFHPVEFSALK